MYSTPFVYCVLLLILFGLVCFVSPDYISNQNGEPKSQHKGQKVSTYSHRGPFQTPARQPSSSLRKQELSAVQFVSEQPPEREGDRGSHQAHPRHVRDPGFRGHPERFGRHGPQYSKASIQGRRLPRVLRSSKRPNCCASAAHHLHRETGAAPEGTHLLTHVQQKKCFPPPQFTHGRATDFRSTRWLTRCLFSCCGGRVD